MLVSIHLNNQEKPKNVKKLGLEVEENEMEVKDLENEAGYSLFAVSSIWLGGFETRPSRSEAAY